MPETVNDMIFNASVRHQMYLQRHSASVVKQSVNLLKKMEVRLLKRLERDNITEFSQNRLEVLLRNVRKIIKDGYKPVTDNISRQIKALSKFESQFQTGLMKRSIPVNLDFVTPPPNQIAAAVKARPFQGRLLKEWYPDLEKGAAARLRDSIRLGFTEGRTTEQIVRDIRGTRAKNYTDGILQQSRRSTQAVVRTALNHTASTAREMTYSANEDLIKGVQWVATLDARTTLICATRDGRVFDTGKGPRPPAHINCRSTTVPVIKSWKQLGINLKQAPPGTRASLDGQVSVKTTYNDFLRKQSASFQDDFLGKRKAQLFRKEKLPLSKFVDKKGGALTLKEIAARENLEL